MAETSPLLYLNARDLDRLDLSTLDIVQALENVFRYKASGETMMPPKIFFHFGKDRFYSAMVSSCPPLGNAGCKWQSGDPANPRRGLPYIQGLYILTDHDSGEMVALMDARWITGRRTAAASALVAHRLARPHSHTLAMIGCGVQGRAHLQALSQLLPELTTCRAYDIVPARQQRYVQQMNGQCNNIEVVGADNAKSACLNADIIITGGPIQAKRTPILTPDWIAAGALVITIDYDSYVTDECIAAMDLVFTDDRAQIEDARRNEGKFTGITRIDADLAELVSARHPGRSNDGQRILAFNLGIALEDVACASAIMIRARARDIGTVLEL